jgi:sucrose synthase
MKSINIANKTGRFLSPKHLLVAKQFFAELKALDLSFFLADQIQRRLEAFLEANPSVSDGKDAEAAHALRKLFSGCQEILFEGPCGYALLRPKIGAKRFVRLHPEMDRIEEIAPAEYLRAKDAYVQGPEIAAKPGLTLNFAPFFQDYPKVREPNEMGEGISFLNRSLSGQLYQNPKQFRQALLRFLLQLKVGSTNLLIGERLADPDVLAEELDAARALLKDLPPKTPFADFAADLGALGFEPGWGCDARRCAETFALLARLFESPAPDRVEKFLERLPLVQRVLLVSPHGWFAQEGVLGRPDTGGQVTYVLDQARALERQMKRRFEESCIQAEPRVVILTRLIPNAEGTLCDVPREKVHGSDNAWIIRVPFRDAQGHVIPQWISRFHVWPYLESYAQESKGAIIAEMMGKPDLIVGNYTDGNLVAHFLAEDWGVMHCALAHALEKTKYLFSDLRWARMEPEYNFSLQFTADIISYNSADFIITSTYREIGGSDAEMGMFESYETFSLPGLYRVLSGMDPQLARYNIVPPGASEDCFFPNAERERRAPASTRRLDEETFSAEPGPDSFGSLKNPDLPPIFAMSRVDRVKNLPGLLEVYGKSERLRESANLVIISSILDPKQSKDQEEIDQLQRMREIIERYQLHGHVRWRAARLDKMDTGEIYRVCADRKGVFAQPAIMETFGLTVIEAMACGLPVAVTRFGGPAEIVEPGVSGEVEDPNDHAAFAAALERPLADPQIWEARSLAGIERVKTAFNWRAHADKMLRLTNTYTYWNYLDVMNRQALDEYIHTLYHAVYRPRAQALLGQREPSR